MRALAGRLSGDETGAALDDISWARLSPWREPIEALDRDLRRDLSNLRQLLEPLPMAVWGQLLLMPEGTLGRADIFLPRFPDDALQLAWTGLKGGRLLRQSLGFAQQIVSACASHGVDLRMAQVLDFGVGWGRIAMLLLKHVAPRDLVGCDAWESSLELARSGQLPNEFLLCEPRLQTLPCPEGSKDLIYASYVFTSLGEASFQPCLNGLTSMLRPGGLLAFNVRPPEYWTLRPDLQDALAQAQESQIYFRRYPEHADYGDTSVSREYIEVACARAGLQHPSFEWNASDPHQYLVMAQR
jgi:ubiquinone/menaquinone biosynthesis C-methylase UbiE